MFTRKKSLPYKLKDSQKTGHNASDFPVALADIDHIEVLEGAASRVFGTSAFLDLHNIAADSYDKIGKDKVKAYYKKDHEYHSEYYHHRKEVEQHTCTYLVTIVVETEIDHSDYG